MHNNFKSLNLAIHQHREWLMAAGSLLIIAGIMVSEYFLKEHSWATLQVALLLSSVVLVMHAFKFWEKKWLGFILHIGAGILYGFLAVMLQEDHDVAPFIYALAMSYLIMGAFRIYVGIKMDPSSSWKWTILAGAINIMLVIYLLFEFDILAVVASASIDLIVTGIAVFALGLQQKIFMHKA